MTETKQERAYRRAHDRLSEGAKTLERILRPRAARMLVALEPDDAPTRTLVTPETALSPLQQRGTILKRGPRCEDTELVPGSRVIVAAFAGMEYEHVDIRGGTLKLIVESDVVCGLDDYDQVLADAP